MKNNRDTLTYNLQKLRLVSLGKKKDFDLDPGADILVQMSHTARLNNHNRSLLTTSPIASRRSVDIVENKRDKIYALNAQLKAEENSRFASFKQSKGIFISAMLDDYQSDSDESVIETPKWILDRCSYYSERQNTKRMGKVSSLSNKPMNTSPRANPPVNCKSNNTRSAPIPIPIHSVRKKQINSRNCGAV